MDNNYHIEDIFDEIVDGIRQTQVVISFIETSGVYTLTSPRAHTLQNDWHVTIDSVEYTISNVTEFTFDITAAAGLDFAGKTWKALEPYYEYGHVRAILRVLVGKDGGEKRKFQKYPLVALILDQQETHGESVNYAYTVDPSLIIVEKTQEHYTTKERKENIYEPVLYPIYDDLIQAIKDSNYFTLDSIKKLPHNKWDRYTWGAEGAFGNTGVIFNDYLDGIEIKLDPIKVINKQKQCEGLY